MDNITIEQTIYPYILFKIRDGFYSVNSKYIETILQMPTFEPIPDSSPNITGVFMHRDKSIQLLDLRGALGFPTLKKEYAKFSNMIDQRKQDHINWVNELERCIEKNEPFKLATDPHKCAFGKWYDNFEIDNTGVLFQLHKIEEPHKKLHEAAQSFASCERECAKCTRPECLKTTMENAKNIYMPQILNLLDETKKIFKSTVYREMILIIQGECRIGLVVDDVLSVEDLTSYGDITSLHKFNASPLLTNIQKSSKIEDTVLEVDIPRLLESIGLDVEQLN